MVVGLKLQELLKTLISFLLHPAEETAAGATPWLTLRLIQGGSRCMWELLGVRVVAIHTALEHKSAKEQCLPCLVQGTNNINDACRFPNDGRLKGCRELWAIMRGYYYYYYYYTERVLMCELLELR